MTRSELVSALGRDNPELSHNEVERIVSSVLDAIAAQLAMGGRVELRGFGCFSTRAREARISRNPRTGAAIEINDKRLPYFKPGKDMRRRLNVSV